MNRRRFLRAAAGVTLAACEPGFDEAPRDYARCLPDHLRELAARARAVREGALAELDSVEAVRRRQAWVTETLRRLTGSLPPPPPSAVRTVGVLEREGYRLEKLLYESRRSFPITAHLYVPTGRRGPFPGVIFQLGHLPEGKAAPAYQSACQALARLGYVVLTFDPVGQGERVFYPGPEGHRSRLGSPDDEHTRAGELLLLAGDTATGLLLDDAMRSLDVLAAHPEVDPRRLAGVGHSGGGTLTMLLAAVDPRLAVAAISCATTENLTCRGFDPPGSTDDAEQNLVGAGPLGFDRWDTLYPLAPKPLLVLVSTGDPGSTYSPLYLESGREEVARLGRIYALLSRADQLRWVESDEPHALTAARRGEIERWLGRFLLGETASVGEPALAPEPEEATWVTPGGNVRSVGSLTPRDLAREQVRKRRARPAGGPASILGVARPPPGLAACELGRVPASGGSVTSIEVRSARSVWVPAWLFEPAEATSSLVIALAPEGRPLWWDEGPWASCPHAVCAADVRGIGALAPRLEAGAPGYARRHADEDSYAWASLVLGESLLAQQVADILALVEALANHPRTGGLRLTLAAREGLTLPALFAAALEPRIEVVYLDGGLASLASVLADPAARCPPSAMVPGIAATADLPDLAAAVSPRRVILAGPRDASGRTLTEADARLVVGDAANVTIAPRRGWGREVP